MLGLLFFFSGRDVAFNYGRLGYVYMLGWIDFRQEKGYILFCPTYLLITASRFYKNLFFCLVISQFRQFQSLNSHISLQRLSFCWSEDSSEYSIVAPCLAATMTTTSSCTLIRHNNYQAVLPVSGDRSTVTGRFDTTCPSTPALAPARAPNGGCRFD